MILWTIQDMAAWKRLQHKGVLRSDGRRIPAYYRSAYRWMADQMRLRLPPHHVRFPLWGWYQCEGIERRRPDLRSSGHLAKGLLGVRIEFDIPAENVLLSDFNSWHCVLNRCYLAISEREDERFDHELDRAGIEHGWPYPEPFHLRVVSSWQRIFDLGAGEAEWWGAPPERSIQATFWELTIPQIRRVDFFRAR